MTYKELSKMIETSSYSRFAKGLQKCIFGKTTRIYAKQMQIEQMRLEKEKLQKEYNEPKRKCNENIYVAESNGTNLANYKNQKYIKELEQEARCDGSF